MATAGPSQHSVELWREYLLDAPAPAIIGDRGRGRGRLECPRPRTLLRRKIAFPFPRNAITNTDTDTNTSTNTSTTCTILHVAWALVNVLYTDCDEVIFGIAVPESDGIDINHAVSRTALPSRFRLDREQRISQCLATGQAQAIPLISSEQITLDDIAALGPDAKDACLFDNQLIIYGHSLPSVAIALDRAINVECSLTSNGAILQAFFDPLAVEAKQMGRILETFESLALQICKASPTDTFNDLDTISAADLRDVLRWNSILPPAVNECMHRLVEQSARRYPEAPAICAHDGDFTYGVLDQMTDRLAHFLISQDVGPGILVPFMFEKSCWAIIAMLAIVKAGGAFVPLDPAHSWSDTETILTACQSRHVICSRTHANRFRQVQVTVVDASFMEVLPTSGTINQSASPDDPGYVIFTSGSTGKPKGVVCAHKAWCTNALAHGKSELITAESRCLQFSAYTFDISVSDVFTTLVFGGCICVPSDSERMNDLARAMRRMKVNQAALTPTVAQFLRPEDVPHLRVLKVGGETMTEEFLTLWVDRVRLMNSYGPAECTSRSCCTWLTGNDDPTTIGNAIGGVVWVCQSNDPHHLVPIGAVGELLVEGNILANGYLRDEDKTAAAFIESPAWLRKAFPERAGRVYRTGDLVQYTSDGRLRFLGRWDTQIKFHGVRLESGHIEAKLKAYLPTGGQVVVEKVTVGAKDQKQLLAAFICVPEFAQSDGCTSGWLVTPCDAVRVFVQDLERIWFKALPTYMTPNLLLPLAAIPMGSTGKINRKTLKTLVREMSNDQLNQYLTAGKDVSVTTPLTGMQASLRALWADVLQVHQDSISPQDSFFRLGGDSVLAMRLVAAARGVDITLTVSDVFQFPKLVDLARQSERVTDVKTHVRLIEPFQLIGGTCQLGDLRETMLADYQFPSHRIEDIYPCTPMQEALMAENMRDPEAYILQEVLIIPSHIRLDQLKKAWEKVVQAYPIMRTRIIPVRKLGTCQVVLDETEPIFWQSSDDMQTYLQQDKKIPMCYGDSLHRFAIVCSSDGASYLVWTVHHAVTDGWLHTQILNQVEQVYHTESVTAMVPFTAFVRHLTEKGLGSSEEYWKAQFANLETASFPSCEPSYQPRVSQYIDWMVALTQAHTDFTASIVLRASWALLLAQYSQSNDVVIGVTQSGRDVPMPGIDQCLGPTIATVPVRIGIDYSESCSQYLDRLQKQYTLMIPYQHTGLQYIGEISRDCAKACSFHNLLVVQPSSAQKPPLLPPIEARNTGDYLSYGLLMECLLGENTILLHAGYDDHVISATQVDRILRQFEHIFHQLSNKRNGEVPLSRVEVASPKDIMDMSTWNPKPEPINDCMHWKVEREVMARPNALAIDSWDGQFTYQEIDRYANRLAGRLIELGVGPEKIVPFMFEKSAWTVIALLGILKAGGACVALDITHPRSRHEKIISDTKAQVVVASKNQARLLDLVPHVVPVDRNSLDALPEGLPILQGIVSPHNAAFVVYSSGSTGTPKGSILEHASLCATSRTNSTLLEFGRSTRVIQFASYAFDVAIEENVISLMYGACICIPSDEERLNDLAGAMRRMNVNWADLTPTIARTLKPSTLPSLKTLVVGGEALCQDIIDTWAHKVDLINTYGPSECSIQCTASATLRRSAKGANIGRPASCRLWVVDDADHDRLLPVGCVGELLIEGQIVGRGYLEEPQKTKAAFIEDPAWAQSGQTLTRRFYKTGDLAKFNEDGSLDCVGRKDAQIKLHGQRVELGEIEYTLKMHWSIPDNIEVVVEAFAPHGIADRKLLVAYLQIHKSNSPEFTIDEPSSQVRADLRQLKEKVANVLPEYMVPSYFVPASSFPLNASGKVDRNKLRVVAEGFDHQRLSLYSLAESKNLVIRTETERSLQRLWAEILHIDLQANPIGAEASFLQLGGDSITAMHLAARARQLGLELSVRNILRSPKLIDMATAAKAVANGAAQQLVGTHPIAALERQSYAPFQMLSLKISTKDLMKSLSDSYDIEQDVVCDAYPCTPLQEGLMALTAESSTAYVLQEVFELPSAIDLPQFKAAWAAVVRENDILRTRIAFVEGLGSCQIVMDERIHWKKAKILDEYLETDRAQPMGYGKELARCAIVGDGTLKYFVWTVHHAIFDGFSYDMILQKVQSTYENKSTLTGSAPFITFIRYIHGLKKGAPEDYWREALNGIETTAFPQLPMRHQPQADNSIFHTIQLSKNPNSDITLSSLLRAAWSLVISCYSHCQDVVIGVTQSGRDVPLQDIDCIVGPTITTVPVRIQIRPREKVKDFLRRVQDQSSEMIPFAHVGLQNIKTLSESAQVACGFQNLLVVQPSSEERNEGSLFAAHKTATKANYLKCFGMVVECRLGDGEIYFAAHHDSKMISAKQMQRVLSQFDHVINQLRQERRTVEDVEFNSAEDKRELSIWNSTYPEVVSKCIHQVIQQRGEEHSSAPAIESREGTITYGEMDSLTTHMAHQLQKLHVGPEQLVPICIEKSPAAILAMLAIQKAGGGFVPLNPKDPVHRLQDLVAQCDPPVLIFSQNTKHLIAKIAPNKPAIVLPSSHQEWSPLNISPIRSQVRPSNIAYALFTSGSTGRPKAVVIEHRAVSSSTAGHGHAMGFDICPRRALQLASYTFDACIAEIFTTLAHGGCICVPTENERMDNLIQFINDFRIDWAFFTPSFVRLLRPRDVPTLKTLVLGGEALTLDNVEVWADKVHLMNGYGPTEACVFCVTRTVTGAKQADMQKPEMIGHAVSSLAWVVNANDPRQLMPIGCVGELLVQGPSLARGYLNEAEKTAEAFIESPMWLQEFGYAKPQRMYRTGDLVRYESDGSLTYLGRKDNQVKMNGQRLELGEIENQLKSKSSALSQAIVVVGKPRNLGSRQTLAAFVQFNDARTGSDDILLALSDELRLHMQDLESNAKSVLPNYMVPSLWIPVNYMPTQISGKCDRKALGLLLQDISEEQLVMYSLKKRADRNMRLPTTDMERQILAHIAKVLRKEVNSISVGDSFFRIGGDSIAAIQVVAAARCDGISLTTEDIFRQPTIEDMAKAAKALSSTEHEAETVAPYSLLTEGTQSDILTSITAEYQLPDDAVEDVLPCTPLQEGLIALTVKDPQAYVLREIFRLPSELDIHRFKAAWVTVIGDATVLRTRIVSLEAYGCYQVVMRDAIAWNSAENVQEYVEHDKLHPFRYGIPLARLALVESNRDGRFFVLTMHHSLYDGWSYGLILKNVGKAYSNQFVPRPQFNRFIQYLGAIEKTEAKEYWTAQFSGLGTQHFPRLPSPTFDALIDKTVNVKIPLSGKAGSIIMMSTVLKAAWAMIICRYTGAVDALFGVTQTGRNAPLTGITEMIGPTIATVPFRVKVDNEMPVSTFLESVQKQTTDMIRYEHTGIQNIQRMGSECRKACEFNNILVLQPEGQAEVNFLNTQKFRDQDKGFFRFGLGMECTMKEDCVEVAGGFDSRLISEVQMQRLLHQFRVAVEQLHIGSAQAVGSIMLFSPEDRAEVIQWNRVIPRAVNECAHHVIHRMVLRTPDAWAVNAWDVDLRYWELDSLTTRLAHFLKSMGVGPETIIPLCFEKSGWSIVAMLAVIKAGGAFVFLDPAYPMARLQDIVNQVGAKFALTSLAQAGLWRSRLHVQVVDEVIELLPSYSEMPNSGVTPQNALYVIFTSGSTGKPKGCIVEHSSFLTGAKAQAERASMSASSRVLQFASYSFDVSILEIITALTVGACICVPNERVKNRSIAAVINDFRISWSFLTPSVVKLIKPSDVPNLKTLILGGETLTTQNVETWADHVQLVNGYGPSECSIAAAGHTNLTTSTDPANIGKACGGLCWITEPNDHNQLAPVGTIGEILIEGPIVARGYLNNPEKTGEVFIEDPAWAESEEGGPPRRMYKTGDLAYHNADGSINFVGRKDTQVKVRGQRLELGEIETHLSMDSRIQHVMILYPHVGPCNQKLVAVVSLKEFGATTDHSGALDLIDSGSADAASSLVTAITVTLAAILPSYMVPNLWAVVRGFSLLPSGKLNRKRVEQWIGEMDQDTYHRICGVSENRSSEAPSTLTEQELQRIWSDVLRLPIQDIGVRQNFNLLGGDSILAMQVVSRCRSKGIKISLHDMANFRTISQLALHAKAYSITTALVEEKANEMFDLTPMQRFYADFALGNDYLSRETNARFNHTFCLRVRNPLQATELSRALHALVARHSMLRARFTPDTGPSKRWMQFVSDNGSDSYQFRAWNHVTLEQAIPCIEEARISLDVEKGPILAADLVTLDNCTQYFFIVAHHLVVDMVSWNIILRDLEQLLAAGPLTSETPFPFSSWARLQSEHALVHLKPATALPVPVLPADFAYWDMDNRINVVRDALDYSISISSKSTAALLQTCKKSYNAEPMDILVSTLSHAFSFVFKDRAPPTIFRYGHGREPWTDRIDVSQTVGWFTTLSPVHVPIKGREDSITVLRRTVAIRQKIPKNGWSYFNSRYCHPDGTNAFAGHDNMEVTINFLGTGAAGRTQDSLFELLPNFQGGLGADGQDVKCFSLFSLTGVVEHGCLVIKCVWNRNARHQEGIVKCFKAFKRLLDDVAARAVPRALRKAQGATAS